MKSVYELTSDEFINLQQSGVLYKLFPELKGVLVNVQQFEQQKRDYFINDYLYNFVYDIVEMTGADPEEIISLIQEHKEQIKVFVSNIEHCDIGDIVERLRGE